MTESATRLRGTAPGGPRGDTGAYLQIALALIVVAGFGSGIVWLLRSPAEIDLARVGGLVDHMTTSAYTPVARPGFQADFLPRHVSVCGSGRRIDCVVDGDTLWLDGEKIRIAGIDAPEVKGRCPAEIVRADEATRALVRLVSGSPVRLHRQGEDRFGRTLADVETPRGDVGEILVALELAARWRGRREPAETWCRG
ncbi:thermonuclease family protein [Oricola sp.]|uniref:thermonuclease family protein n=1 Tax=Oricola sp. TaxID=1979950 RepID=UPI003BA8EFE8